MNHHLRRLALPLRLNRGGAPRPATAWRLALLCALLLAAPGGLRAQGTLPPIIVTQPQNQSVPAGGAATFSVIATGAPPLSYRWFGTAGPIANATGPTLTLNGVDVTNTGIYDVKVTNGLGSARSTNALLVVSRMDFGDAPAVYPTLLQADGARHGVVAGMHLGADVSYEPDGQPDPNASLDTYDDGVTFLTALARGGAGKVSVVASAPGRLDAWIDFDANGDWAETSDQIFTSIPLVAGTNVLSFPVPATAAATDTFARFRYSSSGGLPPNGPAADGEVEDYRVHIFASASDLCVSAVLSPDPLPPPGQGRCQFSVTNRGPSPATNVNVTNVLPGVDFLMVQEPTGACAVQGDRVVCTFGSLLPGEMRTASVDFRPRQPSLLTNVLTARSDVFDPNSTNNRSVVVLRAADPLLITTPPQSQTVLAGSSVTLTVTAKGVGQLTYLWLSNGVGLAASGSPALTLVNVQESADFRVQITDAFGSVLSPPATLTVVKPPVVLAPPTPTNVVHGDPAQFTVQADGTPPLQFQWRLNGANIPGATNSVYALASVARADGGTYTVAIANAGGVTVSDAAPLLCPNIATFAGGNNFAARPFLPTQSGPFQGVLQADNFNASVETGEPNHAGRPGGASVWYRWTAPVDGIATLDTIGSTFDTLLAVYRGIDFSNLVEAASDEDRGGYFRSLVRFNVSAGQTYSIAIDGFNNRRGTFVLAWNLEPTSQFLPVIVVHPTSQTVLSGTSVTLSVMATGQSPGTPLQYQWLFNGEAIPGAIDSVFTIQSVEPQRVGAYTVSVGNSFNRVVESRPAIVEIGSFPGVRSHDKVEDVFLSGTGGGSFHAAKSAPSSFGGPPPFISVAFGIPGSQTLNNTNSTADIDCFTIGSATRWLGVLVTNDPAATGCVLRVDTIGSAIATELAVYRFTALSCLQSVPCMHTNIAGCDTNSGGGGGYSLIQFSPQLGGQYLCFADGLAGAQGVINFNWQLGRPPAITPAQSNCVRVVAAGTNLTLSSGVTNAIPAPGYRWFYNGLPVAGGTNSTLTLTNLPSGNAGTYTVVASNLFGVVTNTCCVIVNPPHLRYRAAPSNAPPTTLTMSSALLPGCVLQYATNLTPPVPWQNLFTNTTTNCNFQFVAPMLDTNGQPYPQRYYRTRTP